MRAHDASIGDALRSALHDIRDLVRSELTLAREELGAEVLRIRAGLLALAVAALFGVAGFLFFLAAIAWALVEGLEWPLWAAFGLVAGCTVPFTIALVVAAMSKLGGGRHMPQTVDTMKENIEWLQARTR